jgi:hypothetical protein
MSPRLIATSSGDAQASLDREGQHRAVAAAFPPVLRWRVKHGLGFLGGEEGHGAPLEALGRDAEHPPDHCGVLGVPDGGVGEQGSDRGEPQVPRPGAVVALGLEVLEERGDHGLVELVPFQR